MFDPEMRFPIGRLVSTPGAMAAFQTNGQHPMTFVLRHCSGDWGDVSEEDAEQNERALLDDGRIVSAYTLNDRTKVWIITEWNRSATTCLLPSEY